MPYFSIIIPAYNREKEIQRAIQSCLRQDFSDFEIVVTDDGSTDETATVVDAFAKQDPRVRLLRHPQNRGVCPARNTAATAARGKWMVLLDSDMSLQAGGLATLALLTSDVTDDIGNVATRIAWDTGIVTPLGDIPNGPLKQEAHLRWLDSLTIPEYFNCIRREVWVKGVKWPDSRAYEASFHLGLSAHWRFQIFSETCATYHTDAANRLCQPRDPRLARDVLIRNAADHAANCEEIIEVHGNVLAKYGPRQLDSLYYRAALNHFLLGHRIAGLRHWFRCLSTRRFSTSFWGLAMVGVMGRQVFIPVYCWSKFSLPAYLKGTGEVVNAPASHPSAPFPGNECRLPERSEGSNKNAA